MLPDPAPGRRDLDVARGGQRLLVLRDLVALGQVGIEVVLAREDRGLLDRAARGQGGAHGEVTAWRLSTGKAPGRPRQTGQTLVLGASPKRLRQAQKILVCVRSWQCTSRPITGSYSARMSSKVRVFAMTMEPRV